MTRKNTLRSWLLCLPAIVFLLTVFAIPLIDMGRMSLHASSGAGFFEPGTWSLEAYRTLATDRYFHEVFWFTAWFGVTVAILCVLIAYPMALAIDSLPPRAKALALAVVVLPKLANVLVIVYGLKLILSNAGPVNAGLLALGLSDGPVQLLNNLTGVYIGKVYLILPYTVLILSLALSRIDPELHMAARGLGAGAFARFLRVTLPLSVPGLSLAFTVSLIFGIGAFVSPYLMGNPSLFTVGVDIQRQTFENLDWPLGAAESIAVLAILVAAVALLGLVRRVATIARVP